MEATAEEIMQFVEENDVKFIRLAFCNIFGQQKNVSIMPNELSRAFEHGISFDASAVEGFLNIEESDLFLHPDKSTLTVLPWRPSHGRVARLFCDIRYPDGNPFVGGSRSILKEVVKSAADKGYTCLIGPECEFYLFELDETGAPTRTTQDNAGYCDIAPLDKGENVRREICLDLEEMGIKPVASHHEQGPGQNEIDFRYSDALTAADNFVSFKAAVSSIAQLNGLYASFMPKPLAEKSGSGLHINLSLSKNGRNIFGDSTNEPLPESKSFIAGILRRIREITVFLNPTTNSYARFGRCEAPKYITWSPQNRSQLIRIPAAKGTERRMELRSPDPTLNPYLAFSLLIAAGLEGIDEGLTLGSPANYNMYDLPANGEMPDTLPANLSEAILVAQDSEFIRRVLPEETILRYLDSKRQEYAHYLQADNQPEWEHERYF